jgi:hypothetical protein
MGRKAGTVSPMLALLHTFQGEHNENLWRAYDSGGCNRDPEVSVSASPPYAAAAAAAAAGQPRG